MTHTRRIPVLIAALALLALAPRTARAQIASGSIHGVVRDASGAPVPAAPVALAGPALDRSSTTGPDGAFRFLHLAPGPYHVTVSARGFAAGTVEVQVGVGEALDVPVTLRVEGVAVEMEVPATAPELQRRRLGTSVNIRQAELAQIPSARDPWALLPRVPGLLVDRVDVGGSEAGTESKFIGPAEDGHNTIWSLDGVAITNLEYAGGFTPTFYDFDTLEELHVVTGGHDPRIQSGGVALNMVTKRAGDAFAGSVRGLFTADSFQGSNVPGGLRRLGFTGNEVRQLGEYGAELGGPVVPGRAWLWGAASRKDVRRVTLTGIPQEVVQDNLLVRLDTLLGERDQATLLVVANEFEHEGRGATITRSIETTQRQPGSFHLVKGELFHGFSPDLFVNARYAWFDQDYRYEPKGGMAPPLVLDGQGVFHNTFSFLWHEQSHHQLGLDGSWFTSRWGARHEVRFGLSWHTNDLAHRVHVPHDEIHDAFSGSLFGGTPLEGTRGFLRVYRDQSRTVRLRQVGSYVSDTLTWDRLTLRAGARLDFQDGRNTPTRVAASERLPEALPAVTFPGADPSFDWLDVSPRLGATWALDARSRTLLRASYANYADQITEAMVDFDHPLRLWSELDYLWIADFNGNGLADPAEVGFPFGPILTSNVDPARPAAPAAFNRIDPDLSAPRTHEAIVGAERAIGDGFTVGTSFTWRRRYDTTWSRLMRADGSPVDRDDYVLVQTLTEASLDGPARAWYEAHGGRPFSVPVYLLDPSVPLAPGRGRLLANRDGYHQRYLGLELYADRRSADRWMVRGSLTFMRWREFFDPEGAPPDPTSTVGSPGIDGGRVLVKGHGLFDRNDTREDVILSGDWQFNVAGFYGLPRGVRVSANLFGRQGYLSPRYVLQVDPDSPPDGAAFRGILVAPPDAERLPDLALLDVGVEKAFEVAPGQRVALRADVFNLLDANQALQVHGQVNQFVPTADPDDPATRIAYGRERELVSPRLLRLGVRWSF